MSDGVNKTVTFSLKVLGDQGAAAAVAPIERMLTDLQRRAQIRLNFTGSAAGGIGGGGGGASSFEKEMDQKFKAAERKAAALEKELDRIAKQRRKNEERDAADAIKLIEKERKEAEKAAKAKERAEAKAAADRERELAREAQQEQKTADYIYRHKMDVWKKQQAEKKRLYEQAARDADKAAKEEQRSADYVLRVRLQAYKQQQLAQAKAAAEVQRANQQMHSSYIAAGEATKSLVQNTIQLAKASAILGISGEENIAIFAKNFVKLEATAQILNSTIGIVGALVKQYRALAAAQAAATVISGASTAKSGVNAAGAVVAGTAAGAGGAAAIGAGGAAITMGVAAAKILAAAMALNEGVRFVRRASGDTSAGAESPTKIILTTLKEVFFDLQKSAADLSKAEKHRLVVMEAAAKAEQSRIELAGRSQAAMEALIAKRDEALGMDDSARANASRMRAMSQLDQAEASFADIGANNSQAQLAALQNIHALKEQIAAADRASVDSAKEQLKTVQDQLKEARELVKQTHEKVRAEADAAKSKLAKFGELDSERQATLRDISKKVERGGDINEMEAKFLKETGFGEGLQKDYFARKGEKAGGLDALTGLGDNDELLAARSAEKLAIEQMTRLKAKEAEESQKLATAQTALVASIDKLVQSLEKITAKEGANIQSALERVSNDGSKPKPAPDQTPLQAGFQSLVDALRTGNRTSAGVGQVFE